MITSFISYSSVYCSNFPSQSAAYGRGFTDCSDKIFTPKENNFTASELTGKTQTPLVYLRIT